MFQGLRQRSGDFMKHITRCWNKKNLALAGAGLVETRDVDRKKESD
jgi:hypothetical protein